MDKAIGRFYHFYGTNTAIAQHQANEAQDSQEQEPSIDLFHRLQQSLHLHHAVEFAYLHMRSGEREMIHVLAQQHGVAGGHDLQQSADDGSTDRGCQGGAEHILEGQAVQEDKWER